jgi:hypothetical protein
MVRRTGREAMKTTEWFRHDCDARNDIKCILLRKRHGWEGYGVFWSIVELLRDADEYKLPLSDIESLSCALEFDSEIMKTLLSIGLLSSDEMFFFSPSLCERMASLDEKRAKLSEAGRRGGYAKADHDHAMAKPRETHGHAVATPQPPLAIRVREELEKSREENTSGRVLGNQTADPDRDTNYHGSVLDRQEPVGECDLVKSQTGKPAKVPRRKGSAYSQDFEAFWLAYPRKVGKGTAWRAWLAQKPPGLDVLLPSVDRAKKTEQWSRDGGQYIPHPSTWITGRRWEDEITTIPQPDGEWKKIKEL